MRARTIIASATELLEIEERQLYHFMTDVRPVGEEKSELYPEPQYFNTAFIAVGALLPGVLKTIENRLGSAADYGNRLRRILSPATALHLSGLAFIATWGREMWLLDEPGADRTTGVVTQAGAPTLSDAEADYVLRFSDAVVRNYRRDGQAYPNPDAALGTDYCILDDKEAAAIASAATPVTKEEAGEVLGLLAVVRSLSFLMEAETREALMMHGPYDAGGGDQLIVFECSDLQWSLFPNFPLPGVRWELPADPFPYGNLAIAMVLRGTTVAADRFGTLYIDPLGPENVVAASLMTRGGDAFTDEGLHPIDIADARLLRRHCDDIQEYLFLQIASWDLRQRMAAGVYQEQMLLLRMLSAAGFDRAEIEAEQQRLFTLSAPIIDRYFERSLARTVEQLPFYQKIGAFAGGTAPTLFTRFAETATEPMS